MKTFKLLPLLSLLLVFGTVNAINKPDEGALTRTHAIDTYIGAVTMGKLQGFDEVVDPSAKFTVLRANKQLISYTKKEMMEFLDKIKNVEENCTTSTSIIENDMGLVVVKVDMKFEDFTRSNYVSIANTGNGWKIINVYSVFD